MLFANRTRTAALAVAAALAISGAAAEEGKGWKSEAGMYAVMETSEGRIVVNLFEKDAPKTVENFVGLAEGTKEFKDPVAGVQAKRPYYDGTVFHRVISNFMMQGGDPTGTGRGNPGYRFDDEAGALAGKHDTPGVLSMANSGPNTNGGQFFITRRDTLA